jgi:hypothetical protein
MSRCGAHLVALAQVLKRLGRVGRRVWVRVQVARLRHAGAHARHAAAAATASTVDGLRRRGEGQHDVGGVK